MRIPWRGGILLWTLGISALTQITAAQEIPADYQQVLKIVGKSGDYKSNVLKVNIPRNDLHMKVAGVALPTPFGFGGWFAITKGDGSHDVLMGDLVLTQEEVNPVMSALLDHGSGGHCTSQSLLLGRASRLLHACPRTWASC
jgi:hypothetical protein